MAPWRNSFGEVFPWEQTLCPAACAMADPPRSPEPAYLAERRRQLGQSMLRVRGGEGPAGGMAASLDPTGFMGRGPARQRQRHRRPHGQQGTPKQTAKV